MADLFGAPRGVHMGIQDLTQMAKAPLELANLQATTENTQLKNQKMRDDAEVDKKMSAMMAGMGSPDGGAPKTQADVVDTLGAMWMKAGDPQKAIKAWGDASLMRDRQAQATAADARAQYEDLRKKQKVAEIEVGQLQTVTDQAGLDALTARVEKEYGVSPPWKGLPYTPELKDQIGKTLLTEKQRMQMALDQDKFKWQKQYQGDLDNLQKLRVMLQARREKRLANAAKAKAGKVSEPTQAQVRQAAATIRLTHSAFTTAPEDLQDNISTIVAEKARALMAKNHALTFMDAAQQALSDEEVHSDLMAIASANYSSNIWHKLMGDTYSGIDQPVEGQGLTSANPLPLPKDKKDLVDGKWYVNYQGVPTQYHAGAQ